MHTASTYRTSVLLSVQYVSYIKQWKVVWVVLLLGCRLLEPLPYDFEFDKSLASTQEIIGLRLPLLLYSVIGHGEGEESICAAHTESVEVLWN